MCPERREFNSSHRWILQGPGLLRSVARQHLSRALSKPNGPSRADYRMSAILARSQTLLDAGSAHCSLVPLIMLGPSEDELHQSGKAALHRFDGQFRDEGQERGRDGQQETEYDKQLELALHDWLYSLSATKMHKRIKRIRLHGRRPRESRKAEKKADG